MHRRPAVIVSTIALLAACSGTVFAQSARDAPLRASLRREAARLVQGPAQPPKPPEGWIVRHPVIVGALIGTGVGAGLSQVDSIGGGNHDPKVALLGTGVGAWAGLIASAVHKARTGQRVGVGTKIGIIAGAVGVIVVPALACYGAGGCGGSS